MKRRLYIAGARIGTSREVFSGGLLLEEGRIARIDREGEPCRIPEGCETVDAGGKVLLPGGVDVHTHFDLDVGFARASDDFYTGTVAAACGGTTAVVDHMAFGPKGCALSHQVEVYRRLAEDAVIDYGFHGVIQHVDEQVLADMAVLLENERIASHKVYMTYDYGLGDEEILRVLERAAELGLTICAHCENDGMLRHFRKRYRRQGKLSARYHPLSRPPQAEAEAVFRFLQLARAAGDARAYVVHLSSREALETLAFVREGGQENVFAETCPQYLLLEDSLYDDDREGLKYIMSPPLRKGADREVLWDALGRDALDTVGTDHCPFFFATQKQRGAKDFTQCPNGAPGVELRYALLFSEGYRQGRLTLPQLVRLCATRPAQLFGLAPRKGDIAVGADADLVLFDPDLRWTVSGDSLHENVDYTPYEGLCLTGKPVMTIAGGEVLVKEGTFLGRKGRGRYVKRTPAT